MYCRLSKSPFEKKLAARSRRAREIKEIEDKKERYAALVEFIKTQHTEKSRWSIEAIADIANEYIDCEKYREFCEDVLEEENRFADGQEDVLGRLLFQNGWGWVVDLK